MLTSPDPGEQVSPGAADSPVLALDVGGTKVALALVDSLGTVIAQSQLPTRQSYLAANVWEPIADAIRNLLGSYAPAQGRVLERLDVGIGSAGPINALAGAVSPVNIRAWQEFALRDRVIEAVQDSLAPPGEVRALLAGDGHCIALGEHWLGAGRDVASMLGIVISTGIGGGAVIDDELFTGTTGNAVHLGHTSINAWGDRCVCGSFGCVEQYASGPAMTAVAQAKGWSGEDAVQLTQAARDGDRLAISVIDEGMRAAAAGIAATVTQLDVGVVVVGGGLSKAGEVIFAPLRRHFHDFATLGYTREVELRPAELPNAGLLGAASLALSLSGRGPLHRRHDGVVVSGSLA